MILNADLVRARCGDIEDAIRRLERFGAMSVDEFVANRDSVDRLPDLRAFAAAVVQLI